MFDDMCISLDGRLQRDWQVDPQRDRNAISRSCSAC